MNTALVLDPPAAPAAVGSYADIVFDRPLDHAYSYAVPPALVDAVGVGKRVECPFGRGDRTTVGYCVNVHADPPARACKEIVRVLDDEALLTDPLLRLTRWMADYYLCGWGQVLQAVLPAGVRDKAGTRESLFVEAVPADDIPHPPQALTPKQAAVLDKLRKEGGPVEMRRLGRLAQVGPAVIRALLDKRYARQHVERVERVAFDLEGPAVPAAPLDLSPHQQAAWDAVRAGLEADEYRAFLLHGVTGSGKTEVYLRAIEEVVKNGREALVLVPEIALTPQTIERFKGRCGSVAVMHSHLTDSERGRTGGASPTATSRWWSGRGRRCSPRRASSA